MFIKTTDTLSAQYSIFRQKEIAGLLKKSVFNVVTSADISNNIQISKSCFVDKIKYLGTDKAYIKRDLVV